MEHWKPDANSGNRDMSEEDRKSKIVALIRERRGYEVWGDKESMKQVDAELKRLGYEAAAPAKRAERRPAASTRKEKR